MLFGVSRPAIYYTINLWNSYNTFKSLPRSGRPKILSPSEKRYILLIIKKERYIVFCFPSKKYDYRFINLKNYIRVDIIFIV
ncbi:hypothetical protein MYCTH_43249 [Thermothelomyces thermophilus ATCC 42464]|uniref:Uncharacterized protein n=1 Tax=Thermothelomyces thermophilus (strain ATCC 42464 / BCRC 31852 / DSM 1799) TaxID=573729 RepID=G2Q1X7_THET4|nr:uncharacterized protein MYCTH_43249 [Thermothelomyces thermophilus ATCC 42464]AEO54209.1 hypothetical protein MYCTH_43249 [Thermothelomyces thermophilus ATCC 42464]